MRRCTKWQGSWHSVEDWSVCSTGYLESKILNKEDTCSLYASIFHFIDLVLFFSFAKKPFTIMW